MALQVGVQLSPTDHRPRQRNARRLGLKTAQHFADDKGRFCNALGVEGPLCFGGPGHGSFRLPSAVTLLRVHTQKKSEDTLGRFGQILG